MRKLCVGNLSRNITQETLQWAFGVFGEMVAIGIITDRETWCPRGFGFLDFKDEASDRAAVGSSVGPFA